MKTKIHILTLLFLVGLFSFSCRNTDTNASALKGKYTGLLNIEYNNKTKYSKQLSVTFTDDKYSSTEFGEGKFTKDELKIKFVNEKAVVNVTNFNELLNGEYDYSISGNRLSMSCIKSDGFYNFELYKQ